MSRINSEDQPNGRFAYEGLDRVLHEAGHWQVPVNPAQVVESAAVDRVLLVSGAVHSEVVSVAPMRWRIG